MTTVVVDALRVEREDTGDDIVDEISFSIEPGRILAIVGESGSGKTTVGTALLGFARRGARISGGSVTVAGTDLLKLTREQLRSSRGKVVAYMPQDPAASLNPALRIRKQLDELFEIHTPELPKAERRARTLEVLDEVNLPATDELLARYPHQLSGGQQQRVAIAMVFLLRPKLIVLDEPTTGLDVTTQAHVLRTVRELCRSHNVAALYVTHDLAVVADLADDVMVMYAGRIAEKGPRASVFADPAHPYTRKLLGASPDIGRRALLEAIPGRAPAPGDRPPACAFAPRCTFREQRCTEIDPPMVDVASDHVSRCHRAGTAVATPLPKLDLPPSTIERNGAVPVLSGHHVEASYGRAKILHGIDFELGHGECLALVGESGSGKTTLARAVIGLLRDRQGEILLNGEPLSLSVRQRSAEARRTLQYIFQSPYNSLNPRKSVGEIISTPLAHFFGVRGAEADQRVADALERVALSPAAAARYPYHLSGGERQRVAIARALVCEPKVLICDEITSALDVSVQAAIVELLRSLRESENLSMLFVTHNLALVRSIADRVIVMSQGSLVEQGPTEAVLTAPQHEYTRQLLDDTPSIMAAAAA